MFKLLRDFGSSFTSGETTANNSSETEKGGMGKNKSTGIKNFKLKKKDVVEELLNLTTKYPYTRPVFMGLRSHDELQVTLDHSERVIALPKRSTLPRYAGYAECTNAGKSLFNEDQAAAIEFTFSLSSEKSSGAESSPATLSALEKLTVFGVFDGHAGPDVAVTVSHELPHRIKERIASVIIDLKTAMDNAVEEDLSPQTINVPVQMGGIKRKPTVDRLIIGSLEAAFHDMDSNLIGDESQYTVKGGCATLVSLFYANKLYISNAGDCRAVLRLSGAVVVTSTDFTPEFERRRLQSIAEQHPDLLGNEFCSTQFTQRVTRKDLGTQMLYRDSMMEGWAYKTITQEDLRFPLILGDGRRSRLLATIGLTRGLGDHKLKVFDSCIKIKPFLTCFPEVKVFDLNSDGQLTADDVLIMGSDGLWDVITNEQAVNLVGDTLASLPTCDNSRYIAAAQALLAFARGVLKADRKDVWVLKNSCNYASHDDITCFVVPLLALPTTPAVQLPTTPAVQLPTTPAVQLPTTPAVQLPTTPAVQLPTTPAVQLPTTPAVQSKIPPNDTLPPYEHVMEKEVDTHGIPSDTHLDSTTTNLPEPDAQVVTSEQTVIGDVHSTSDREEMTNKSCDESACSFDQVCVLDTNHTSECITSEGGNKDADADKANNKSDTGENMKYSEADDVGHSDISSSTHL